MSTLASLKTLKMSARIHSIIWQIPPHIFRPHCVHPSGWRWVVVPDATTTAQRLLFSSKIRWLTRSQVYLYGAHRWNIIETSRLGGIKSKEYTFSTLHSRPPPHSSMPNRFQNDSQRALSTTKMWWLLLRAAHKNSGELFAAWRHSIDRKGFKIYYTTFVRTIFEYIRVVVVVVV